MTDRPSDGDPDDPTGPPSDPDRTRTESLETADAPTVAPDGRRVPIPDRIGPYRLIRKLGEGGMGVVFEAEQTEPVRRRVAIKLIKAGMDTDAVIARFESERQALALMNHPCIAQVLDAGATDQGRSYFVMELVRGEALDRYCDERHLTVDQRLQLFVDVCHGIHHAHQKGIIHRDLKPSNILVTTIDDRPVPKIIDFGIAKATDLRLTEKSIFTETGRMIGTPEYMSPEQADPLGVDIDIRTDVYALGVVLYKLLAGSLPFESQSLRSSGYEAIRRKIREETPSRPSTRLTTIDGDQSDRIATDHGTDLRSLTRELRGDLDWITMRALEKDRARRYRSAVEFADDILRHMNNEPVSAGPPSLNYRAQKFVRRHRIGVAFAAMTFTLMIVAVVGTTVGMVRALRAEASAVREAELSRRVSSFLVDLFEDPDPLEGEGGDVSAREILDRGVRAIETELTAEPYLRSRLMETMGLTYRNLGLYAPSESLLQRALELRRVTLGPDHPEVAEALNSLGAMRIKQGRPADARPSLEEALRILESAPGAKDVILGRTLNNLGGAALRMRDYEAARTYLERALAVRERTLGPEDPDVAKVLTSLGTVYRILDDPDRARRALERAIAIREKAFGPEHATVGAALNNLAAQLRRNGDLEGALANGLRAVAIHEATLGPEHTDLASSLSVLGSVRMERGEIDEAVEALERAHAIRTAKLRDGATQTLRTERLLVRAYLAWDTPEKAVALMQARVDRIERSRGPDDPSIVQPLLYLAESLAAVGRTDEAESAAARAKAIEAAAAGS